MRMVEAMDAGPILVQREEPIGERETAADLAPRLSALGAEALVEALALLSMGLLEEAEQDDALATYAPKIDRETSRVDWSRSAVEISNLVRAMDDQPGAWTLAKGEPLKLFRPEPEPGGGSDGATGEPGTVVAAGAEGLIVATGGGRLRLGEVQPAGKRRKRSADWIRGHGVRVGDRLG
jgi:methionyl-tRNA formyltransferase